MTLARGLPSDLAAVRGPAIAVVAVTAVAVVCIIVFYAVGGPFGTLNDIANAGIGLASVVLAWQLAASGTGRPTGTTTVALAAAGLGAAAMVVGSYLVISGVTGWYLAGLVSALGGALIGLWLLVTTQWAADASSLPPGLRRIGLVAAIVLLLGLLVVPGIVSRVDDWGSAPWYVNLGLAGWLGIYVAYPLWCWRLAGAAGP